MQPNHQSVRRIVGIAAIAVVVFAAVGGSLWLKAAADSGPPPLVALAHSVSPTGDARATGQHPNSAMLNVEVYVNPNQAAENATYAAIYSPTNPQYHHWLAKGQFAARFAPSAAQLSAVRQFLTSQGLHLVGTASPFIVAAGGTTAQVQATFHTTIQDYIAKDGTHFYQNTSPLLIPGTLAGVIQGVAGMQSSQGGHSNAITANQGARAKGVPTPNYGAGPGGSGLTPSQVVSMYNGQDSRGQGANGQGVTLAVYELSGYNRADITAYAQQFFGAHVTPHIVDVNVDGGPLTPNIPACLPGYVPPTGYSDCAAFGAPDYSGDIEVEADIEMQLAVAPQNAAILVYNAPNDIAGVTALDEYFQIAADDAASTISSSWDLCELDGGYLYAASQYGAFKQMAMQGQSIFVAAGDSGAYGCLRGSGNPALSTGLASSNPFVTSVGGTSFSSYDPGNNPNPSYPYGGFETVWNPLNLCSSAANCGTYGAGGGGVSQFWPTPAYQNGPGVIGPLSQHANTYCNPYGGTYPAYKHCREVPDVSANADEFTPYAEYCSGVSGTNSACSLYAGLGFESPVGWLGIGGTSLATPVWSAIIADWESYHSGQRFGFANEELYELFRAVNNYSDHFHDITGANQVINNNGYYPATKYYDMATGIGTPRITGLVHSTP